MNNTKQRKKMTDIEHNREGFTLSQQTRLSFVLYKEQNMRNIMMEFFFLLCSITNFTLDCTCLFFSFFLDKLFTFVRHHQSSSRHDLSRHPNIYSYSGPGTWIAICSKWKVERLLCNEKLFLLMFKSYCTRDKERASLMLDGHAWYWHRIESIVPW